MEFPTTAYNKFVSNVAVITSNGPVKDNVMTCAWMYRISMNPMLVAVSVAKERATYKNIVKTKEFGVNVCSDEQNVLSNISGSYSAEKTNKIEILKELGFEFYKAKKIKCLMIENCSLNMECKVVNELETGDHVLFIGEVVDVKLTEKEPLLYAKGKYWKTGDVIEKPSSETLEKIRKLVEKHKR